ncbi:MAG: hypothetical protein OEZ32_01065 [Nitrospinota bacterium]|nr:hypothetical protein [Nitrospinota bacterium]
MALLVAACSGPVSQAPEQEKDPGNDKRGAEAGQAPYREKKASFHFNGKEYILSFGGKLSGEDQLSSIALPVIPGARVDNFVAGVHENSVTLFAKITLDDLMGRFAAGFPAKDWAMAEMAPLEGMASAKWTAKNGGAAVWVYAMAQDDSVIAKIVTSKETG